MSNSNDRGWAYGAGGGVMETPEILEGPKVMAEKIASGKAREVYEIRPIPQPMSDLGAVGVTWRSSRERA